MKEDPRLIHEAVPTMYPPKPVKPQGSFLERHTTEDERKAVIRSVMDKALAGDRKAEHLMFSRLVPPLKPENQQQPFDLDTANLQVAAGSILEAISAGVLSADVGAQLLRSLRDTAEVGHLQQMAQAVSDLQARLGQMESRQVTPGARPITGGADGERASGDTPPARRSWAGNLVVLEPAS